MTDHLLLRGAACKTLPSGCDSILLRTRMPWSCRTGEGAVGMCSIPILKMRRLKIERLRSSSYITELGNSIAECRPSLAQSQACPCNLCRGGDTCRVLRKRVGGKLLIKESKSCNASTSGRLRGRLGLAWATQPAPVSK